MSNKKREKEKESNNVCDKKNENKKK